MENQKKKTKKTDQKMTGKQRVKNRGEKRGSVGSAKPHGEKWERGGKITANEGIRDQSKKIDRMDQLEYL